MVEPLSDIGPDVSNYFSEKEIACIKTEAPKAEKEASLTQPMLTILRKKDLFKLFVPHIYGGSQSPLPDALEWLEAASWLDGSFGWTLTLAAGAGLFGAFMDPEFAQSVFANKNFLISGSGFPGGKAEITEDGYKINGQWKYATGIEHATLITATCYVTKDGRVLQENGTTTLKAMSFFPDEVSWNPEWKSYGLKATGSYNFTVKDVQIPTGRSFTIAPSETHVDDPLYRYPFEPFAQCTLAISLIGMAGRFLNEASMLIEKRNNGGQSSNAELSRLRLSNAQEQFGKARKVLYEAVENSWQSLENNNKLASKLAADVSRQSRLSCEQALQSAQQVYPFLGMAAIDPSSAVNRFWRDLHTASQHMLLTPTGTEHRLH